VGGGGGKGWVTGKVKIMEIMKYIYILRFFWDFEGFCGLGEVGGGE